MDNPKVGFIKLLIASDPSIKMPQVFSELSEKFPGVDLRSYYTIIKKELENNVGDYRDMFPLSSLHNPDQTALDLLFKRLEHFNKFGHFDKTFITESGPHINGLTHYGDNIKIKFKRNFFIQINKDGNIYLIDTFKEKDDPFMTDFYAQGVKYRGVQLVNWRKMSIPQLLGLLEKWFNNHQIVVNLALSKLNPVVVAKVKLPNGRLVKSSNGNTINAIPVRDVANWIKAGIVVDTKNKQREPQKIKVR